MFIAERVALDLVADRELVRASTAVIRVLRRQSEEAHWSVDAFVFGPAHPHGEVVYRAQL